MQSVQLSQFTPTCAQANGSILYWLQYLKDIQSQRERINFKVACLVCQSLSGKAPVYLADDCCLVSDSAQRSLRSGDVQTCVVPRTYSSYGDRNFAVAGPRLWNSLPVQLCNPDITYRLFRWQLKGHIFGNHGHGALWLLICSALEKHLLTLQKSRWLEMNAWSKNAHVCMKTQGKDSWSCHMANRLY